MMLKIPHFLVIVKVTKFVKYENIFNFFVNSQLSIFNIRLKVYHKLKAYM